MTNRAAQVKIGEYFGKRPVVLSLVYYKCPMLCDLVLNGMLRAFRTISLDAGKDSKWSQLVSTLAKHRLWLPRKKQTTSKSTAGQAGPQDGIF